MEALLLGTCERMCNPKKRKEHSVSTKTYYRQRLLWCSPDGWHLRQINGVQAKYEQDVADYQAVVAGDTLPLQARMEKASPRQSGH